MLWHWNFFDESIGRKTTQLFLITSFELTEQKINLELCLTLFQNIHQTKGYTISHTTLFIYTNREWDIYTAYLYIIWMLMLLIQEKWMQTRTCISTYTFTRWAILTYPLKAFFGKGICKYLNAIIIIIIEIRAYSASTSTCNLFSLFGSLHFEMKV